MDPQPRGSRPETKKGYVGSTMQAPASLEVRAVTSTSVQVVEVRTRRQDVLSKEKAVPGEAGHKREDPSDGGKDMAVSR